MLGFEWNALRVGDQVIVHDDDNLVAGRQNGTVRMVQTSRGGSNDLAIEISGPNGGPSRIVRPRRLAVHLSPFDPMESCWRCDSETPPASDDGPFSRSVGP